MIRVLSEAQAHAEVPDLARVLVDCVEGGASVSFMSGFSQADGEAFFATCAEGVARGERVIIAAELDGKIVGTAQLILNMPPNQPHRADVAKMLVHRDARCRGVGLALLRACEAEARRHRRTRLVLDTVEGSVGERLYRRGGWTRVGVIPDYALMPDGRLCATVYYTRHVPPAG
jgi:GNAT superfamily N-acetyltransferase